jgi:hypothetical protein
MQLLLVNLNNRIDWWINMAEKNHIEYWDIDPQDHRYLIDKNFSPGWGEGETMWRTRRRIDGAKRKPAVRSSMKNSSEEDF